MTVATDESDVWLSPDDWAEAFEAPAPGTPHNEARDEIWAELLAILADKNDGDETALRQNHDLRPAFNRAGPALDAADPAGALGAVPAYLRRAAPSRGPDHVR